MLRWTPPVGNRFHTGEYWCFTNGIYHPGSHYWDYYPGALSLTHWGRVTHIGVSKLTTFGPDNGLSPGRRQAIIRTNIGVFNWTPRNKLQWNLNWNWYFFIKENPFESDVWKRAAILPQPQCVKTSYCNSLDCLLLKWVAKTSQGYMGTKIVDPAMAARGHVLLLHSFSEFSQ